MSVIKIDFIQRSRQYLTMREIKKINKEFSRIVNSI